MKVLLLIALFPLTITTLAQQKIEGKVVDQKGRALAGVSIAIKDSYDGATSDSLGKATSDSLGNFSFNSTEEGKVLVEATYTGYSSYNKMVELDGKDLKLDISLKELITELKAVVITAGSFEAGDKKKTTVLSSLDIVTTASAEGDITGALKTLPGTGR